MNLYLFDEDRIIIFTLPIKKIGNFWMKDSNDKNVVNIEAKNNEWYLGPSKISKVYDGQGNTENLILKYKAFYLVEKNNKRYILYSDYSNDTTFNNYSIKDNSTIKVGKSALNNICIPLSCINDNHLTLTYINKKWNIILNDNSVCYLNNKKVNKKNIQCNFGDVINLYGVKILLICDYIFVNNPFNNLKINGLEHIDLLVDDKISNEEIENEDMYKDEDYFLKSPRIRKKIETYEMKIDNPPQKENIQEMPLWVTLAPMLTMAASSLINVSNGISEVIHGSKTFKQLLPTLIISLGMVFTMLVWPFITKKFNKKQKEKKEEERQTLYQRYLNDKDRELSLEYENQKRTIEENIISTDICYDMITNTRRTLWSRRKDQDDFLIVRVGIGDVKFDTNITYHTEDFTMDSDNLKNMLNKLINYNKVINNVPIGYSFVENPLTAINGIYPKYVTFMNNVILQLMAFHSYDDLKIVIFTNDNNKYKWEYLKGTPYCFSNNKQIRFFATKTEEMQEISDYLSQVYNNRKVLTKNGNGDERVSSFMGFNDSYYLIIIDDIDKARKVDIIKSLLKEKHNLGFSIVVLEEKLSKIPSEVSRFIIIGEKTSTILNTTNNDQIKFIEETNDKYDMNLCAKIVSNLPIKIDEEQKQLPNSVTFLELFGVGKIEQLNVLNRWKENNPVKSLKTEIGINTAGDNFVLDLHEKFHGPHGLIAGMTGSGKSEFIITYVLSMAVNYSPEEVAFVLIDYKGGGLAGAFVDNKTGEKLPHVVGTITNLDKTEINRALASINSELTRRQKIFNDVKVKTGEGTVDIYKYQKLYRDGVLNEPMPHLIIVCDEFAELKNQQPEFMDDLISTARIGRSLGVHLILATQKPSGVVDGQIWSNSKFKVCLKVQDKEDSMEMIRNDLAAELKNVGRFYLLVGYNEYFATGQAAWAGAQYYPNNEYKKSVDKNLYLIDNVGSVVKTINNTIAKKALVPQGEELTNIVKYLIETGKNSELNVRQLWLDRIPNKIYINDLAKKYNYQKVDYNINPIFGEYDDPTNQSQYILTLNFSADGNTIIYGMNDSGKDELIQSLVYSMLTNYTPDELNLYLLDFGSEILSNFNGAPQIGDILINGDDEKIHNLPKLLLSEMVKRKKMFTEYGGNYETYIKNSNNKLPNIVVIINSIEVLTELYPDVIEKIIQIIRDGSKYGIYFVFTTENQSTIKMKISQSCRNLISLQLTNPLSYRDILGNTNGLLPSKNIGRGLVKKERVCEFQTAFISESDVYSTIKQLIDELKQKYTVKAASIDVMPDIIKIDRFISNYKNVDSVPLGIVKESLNSYFYNYKKNVTNIVCSNDLENTTTYVYNTLNALTLNKKFNTFVIDACNYFDTFNFKLQYLNNNFNSGIDSIKALDEKYQEVLVANNMNFRSVKNMPNYVIFIIGFGKFFGKLDDDHKKIFKEILSHNKEYPKINFILVDIPSGFKKYEYEEWYKGNFDPNNGIWIGPGLSQQFVLKTITQSASLSTIALNYAVVIKDGIPTIVKLINEIKR